jgi:DNA polymerase III delta subunit
MILCLHGNDTYRSKQKFRAIYDHAQKKQAKYVEYDLPDLTYNQSLSQVLYQCKQELHMKSLFSEKRLFVIRNLLQTSISHKHITDLSDHFQELSDIVLVILEEQKIPKNHIFLKKLTQNQAKIEEFSPLKGGKLYQFIQKQAAHYSTTLDQAALNHLTTQYGSDLYPINMVLNKVYNCYPEEINITQEMIETVSPYQEQANIFLLSQYFLQGKYSEMYLLITTLESHSTDKIGEGMQAVALLISQIRKALLIQNLHSHGQDYHQLQGKTYGLDMLFKHSKHLSQKDLTYTLEVLSELDKDIKHFGTPPYQALRTLAMNQLTRKQKKSDL